MRATRKLEYDVETARGSFVIQPRERKLRRYSGFELDWPHVAVEHDLEIFGFAEVMPRGERADDACLDVLGGNHATRACHRNLAQTPYVHSHQPIRPYRIEHGAYRHRAGLSEVGRAEDRRVRRHASVLHKIADAHDIGGNRGLGF